MLNDGTGYVQLQGACVGCSSSGATVKFGIEREMKTRIHPVIKLCTFHLVGKIILEQLG